MCLWLGTQHLPPLSNSAVCVLFEHREARPDISSIIVKRRMKKDFWHDTTVTHDTPLPLPHTRLPHFWVQLYQIWQCVSLGARDSHFLSQFWRIVRHGIFPCSFEYMQITLAYSVWHHLTACQQSSGLKHVAGVVRCCHL
jgi:hypothetical protein